MKKVTPFLKWAWSKRQVIDELAKYYPPEINNYFEPFLWGWSVYFDLKSKGLIWWRSYLSDLNEELAITYNVIQKAPIELIKALKDFRKSNTKEFYLRIREWDRDTDYHNKYTDIERAARFIYLNKTCFNGIWRVNSKNHHNVPYWKNNNPSIFIEDNLLDCHYQLNDKTLIDHYSFDKIEKKAKKWDFIFLDPPYDPLTDTAKFTSYTKEFFNRDTQVQLSELYRKLDRRWCRVMLTNSYTDFIKDLYKDYAENFKFIRVKRIINRDVKSRNYIEEVLITNY